MNNKWICLALSLAVILVSCSNNNTGEVSPVTQNVTAGDSLQDFISYSSDAIVGETVYVPVYSHIYQQNHNKTFNLTATLSIRNTDLHNPIVIKKVYYYDSDGKLIHKYLDGSRTLTPLSSTSFVIEEEDLRGGVGANYIVLWEAKNSVNKPILEAVMISTSMQQGVSFISEGKAVDVLNLTSQ